jgi:multiple sugar transport system permease protein
MVLRIAALLLGLIFVLLPIAYTLSLSLRIEQDVMLVPPHLLPPRFTLDGYLAMRNAGAIFRFIGNTAIVSAGTIMITVTFAGLAAYSFARLRFRFAGAFMLYLLISQMFPGAAVIVPLFKTLRALGLYNSHPGLILLYAGFTIPFCTWMFYGYLKTIPKELEEAALIDGCSRLRSLWSVIAPLALPGTAATAVFVMLAAWNEFTFASLFLQDNDKWLITPGLNIFIGQFRSEVNTMAAAAIYACIPPLLAFILVRRYFISGLVAGALKG